mmetsp:Transcript_109580/g.217598  ORF Transcript_109580/g.217598 Transcript_109580/m.217598 type:complete len:187 (-) Transcript_109580:34-594(-)
MLLMRRSLLPSLARVSSPMHRCCAIGAEDLPVGLRQSESVSVRLQTASQQLQPTKDGKKVVGLGDRGSGLVYRDGRPASSSALERRETGDLQTGVWIVKIQPPLDVSSDSAGGLGKITPATLLLSNRTWSFVRFVTEDDEGHFPLLRCALSEDDQIAYRFAEEFDAKEPKLRVFTALKPERALIGW